MTPGTSPAVSDLEDFVSERIEAFETARTRSGCPDLADFLPTAGHPYYLAVLQELVRVDLEYSWSCGRPRPLREYRLRFPALFEDPQAVQGVAFEEYRLRLQAGWNPSPEEYRRVYGVDPTGWPSSPAIQQTVVRDCAAANLAILSGSVSSRAEPEFRLNPLCTADDVLSGPFDSFRVRVDPGVGPRNAGAPAGPNGSGASLPEIGSDFLGFHLIAELGRGAFGRVFLAQQGRLANRLVALKVGTELFGEEQTLAQLQHTNIVPVYSVHQADPFQAVCMPYFGSTTLADILRGLQKQGALPDSGRHFVSTLQDRKSTVRPVEPSPGPNPPPEVPAPAVPAAGQPHSDKHLAALETLERFSYVEAVVWMGARLADGLAHAHERGICHRDLKPANILLTDEGQPMLLDFNLSQDAKLTQPKSRGIGGTLAYMAPEQIEAFREKAGLIDGRSDIYSLGLVLFELLTGRQPFAAVPGPMHEILPRLAEQRRLPAPALRPFSKAVSPAVEAIIRRCLEPDPARRYPTARALQQDLDRHLASLPLQHTPEPSLRERARKWLRRHPKLAANTLAAVAVVLLLAATLGLAVLWERQQVRFAADHLDQFVQKKALADFILGVRTETSTARLKEGMQQAEDALRTYRILEDPRWQESALVRRLPAVDRDVLREEAVDLLWVLARGKIRQAEALPAAEQEEFFQVALDWNRRAEEILPGDAAPRALRQQRADLARWLKREEARALEEEAGRLPLRSARDRYLLAVELREKGRAREADDLLRQAVELLREETDANPGDFRGWFLLGNCHDMLRQNVEALQCYTACVVLRPDRLEYRFNRGLVYFRQKRWKAAEKDFSQVLAVQPDQVEALAHRALAAKERGDYRDAERDLTRVLELDRSQTRFFFLRATVREKLEDKKGARSDREEGLRLVPGDAASWVDRGIARLLDKDANGALADFEQALKLDRRYFPAWQDKAHVLSDYLSNNEEALKAMQQAVALNPDFVPARLGRGVLLARLGKRDEAHRDAKAALDNDASPPTLYQAANIYALTSRQNADDRLDALPLLARALAGGFGLDVIGRDSDMDPIRHHPDFRRIVAAARELHGRAKK